MTHTYKFDNAVSPVIGTILLVAITVGLAAVISAVIMGMNSEVSDTKNIGVTAEPVVTLMGLHPTDAHIQIRVLIYGGTDVDKLTALNVSLDGAEGAFYDPNKTTGNWDDTVPLTDQVGKPIYYTPYPQTQNGFTKSLLTVTGTFTDGISQVLFKKAITIVPEQPYEVVPYLSDPKFVGDAKKHLPYSPKFS